LTGSFEAMLDQPRIDSISEEINLIVSAHVTKALGLVLEWMEIRVRRLLRRKMSIGRDFPSPRLNCLSQRLTSLFCCGLPRSVVCCNRKSLLDVRSWYTVVSLLRYAFVSPDQHEMSLDLGEITI